MPDQLPKGPELETLLKYFDAARTNIITRLTARDQCILLCLAAVAGIMTAAFAGSSSTPRYDVLLVLPIVSLVVSVFVAQHNFMMDTLYVYIAKEITPHLRNLGVHITPWELSLEYRKTRGISYFLRFVGEVTVILFPAIFSLYTYPYESPSGNSNSLFYVGIGATFAAFLIICLSTYYACRHPARLAKAQVCDAV